MIPKDPLELGRQLRHPEAEAGIATGLLMNDSNRVMYDDMLSLLPLKPGYKILEIGFGNGAFLHEYFRLQQDIHVTGIDFSETMVQEAIKNNHDLINRNRLELLLADARNMPFADESFDVVVTINTLYFWQSPVKQVQEIKRVLKPGGHFLLGFRPKEAVKDAPFTKEVFTLYEPVEAKQLLQSGGFAIEKESKNNLSVSTADGKKINMPGITLLARK